MKTRIPQTRARGIFTLLLLCLAPLAAGCARYAPEPPPPTRLVMDITLTTAEPVSSDFYYYLAFNITTNLNAGGPSEQLSGTDRVKNWNYYLLYEGPSLSFKERYISAASDIDLIPNLFNESSPRFYSASASGNTIHLIVYVDALTTLTTPKRIWMNFVTSRYPISDPERDDIEPVDYIYPPYFYVMTNQFPLHISNENYAQISSYTPVGDSMKPANITAWSVSLYHR